MKMRPSPTHLSECGVRHAVRFERRDIILAVGVSLLAVGLIPFVEIPAIAAVIAAAVFFGIKWYSGRRQRQILSEVGRGICAECGSAVTGEECPQCGGRSG